ncbi:hypothetical protein H7I01_07760, partial [Mycobacterium palustre]|nr:hypothetical protein [Mycobacterium palustre]
AAAAQLPQRPLAPRTGQRLRLGRTQPHAPPPRTDPDLAPAPTQGHRRQQGDRAQRLLLLAGPKVRNRAVVRRPTAHGVGDQPPGRPRQGPAPGAPGGPRGVRPLPVRRAGAGRDHGRPALPRQPHPAARPARHPRPPTPAHAVSPARQRARAPGRVFAAVEGGAAAVSQAAHGHVCGTCRFGTDPKTSVLDPQNRAHEVHNLYVVDTSFFPSSAGLNPSLTVAANALRVATHINDTEFAN